MNLTGDSDITPELDGVEEQWEDGEIQEVTVTVKHDSPPHNEKTFLFEVEGDSVSLKNMDMAKGSHWTWDEQEIRSMPAALELAKRTAEERTELDDVLDGN